MKRLLLSATVLAAAVSGGAHASILSISALGGFIEGSAGAYPPPDLPVPPGAPPGSPEGFAPVVNYFGCADSVCTSFSWGTPTDDGGPFGGQSAASINLGENPNSETGEGGAFGDDSDNDGSRNPRNVPVDNSVAWHPNPLGVFLPLGSLTHFNEVITGDPAPGPDGDNGFIGKVGVDYEITIDKYEDDGETFIGRKTLPLIFDVVFFETLNSLSGDDCPTEVIGGECADSFEFFGDRLEKFEIAGQKYTIELVGFCDPALSAEDCRNSNGVFISAEGETSTAFVFEIKEAPVPGVLALLAAGLIGLGFARRRAQA